jgi:hypothetical protein
MADTKTQTANENTTDSTGKRGRFDLLNGVPKNFPDELIISAVYVPAGVTFSFDGEQAVENERLLDADPTLLPAAVGKTYTGPVTLPLWYKKVKNATSTGGTTELFYGKMLGSL